jgi:pyruvate dehydrogenase E2 component (dihydrolipoamide acetyltransferase)
MATTIHLPELGEGVDSVDVVAVLISVGDTIEVDQGLIEVETEKASVEVPSTAAGTVTEIHVSEGDVLGENAPIVTLDTVDDKSAIETDPDPDSSRRSPEAKPGPEPDAVEEKRGKGAEEQRGEGGEEREDGDAEEQRGKGEEEQEGGEAEEKRGRGEKEQEEPSAGIESTTRAATVAPTARATDEPHSELRIPNSEFKKPIPAAPSVRRFAREVGIDLSTVQGSRPSGRISIDDVKAEVNRRLSAGGQAPGVAPALELPDLERFGPIHREAMTKVRKVTAQNLTRAWATAPQVTNHEIADITDLEEFRKAYKERVAAAGGKLTMTAVLVKIVASALKSFPVLNASVDMARHEIVFRYSVNIGVAVDTERGLLVPVIRDADDKSLTEISIELDDLANRARSKKLKPDEMQGGTFSISNLGGIGGTAFTPIVNWPEVAILGVSRGRIEPQWHEGSFRPRLMMPLSLSYDHRLVDGADAARFLAKLKDALEQPLLLALEG